MTSTTPTAATPRPPVRLPGQAAAPEGPVDMTMMYLSHHAFRRDLAAFAAAVPVTPVEDRGAWRALADRWRLFSHVLHHHHAGEDEWVWPFLLERVGPEDREVLEAMEAEHAEIDPTLEACAAGMAWLAEHADADARAALAVRVVAARESLGRHLAHEETEAIALMQRVMTGEEWEQLDEHFKEALTLRDLPRLVPWALLEVPPSVREQVFARPGGFLHRVVWVLTRRAFNRYEARAFRYLPTR